jgi:hypothetical protein
MRVSFFQTDPTMDENSDRTQHNQSNDTGRNPHSSRHVDGSDEWAAVRTVLLSPAGSSLSDLTRNRIENMDLVRNNGSPYTNISAEEFVDGFQDPAVGEEAYDRQAHAEAPGGEDSDDEHGGIESFVALRECLIDRANHQDAEFAATNEDEDDEQYTVASSVDGAGLIDLPGAPPGWKRPAAPANWKGPIKHKDCKVPKFADVDNPGGWSEFNYQPKFVKAGGKGAKYKYLYHCQSSGATVVPEVNGKRSVNGWDFNYTGTWHREFNKTQFRSGATKDDPFPACRKGSLDADVLSRLGLTKERMLEEDGAPDALFFHQLLLPIINPDDSGIAGDPRKAFYSQVSRFSNLYAIGELGLGNGLGHMYRNTDGPELLRFDGVVQRHGVLGGGGGILRRFDTRPDNAMFLKEIALSGMSNTLVGAEACDEALPQSRPQEVRRRRVRSGIQVQHDI